MSDTPDLTMLGERTTEEPDRDDLSAFVKDTSQPVEPASFDSSAFLAGVRPTRRSVQIIERPDLVGDMERLAQEFAEADAEDDDEACERVAGEFDAVAAQFHDSKRWYTLEKRSGEWVEKFRKDTASRLGLDVGDETQETDDQQEQGARMAVALHQLAAQIVSPEGTTAADLEALYERNEGELNKLIVAMTLANTQQAAAVKVATPGFSLRRSEKKGTPGSSRR